MSAISRIEKMVCEVGGAASLGAAAGRLARPLEVRIASASVGSAVIVAPAIVACRWPPGSAGSRRDPRAA